MIQLLASLTISKIITNSVVVRVHTSLAHHTWAPLWYLLRAVDINGTGYLEIELNTIQSLLGCHQSTIYRLLQAGAKHAAFRRYKIKNGTLHIYLGSLFKVCSALQLDSWGAVAEVSLAAILTLTGLKSMATAILTIKNQQQSRYAANSKLKPEYRKQFGAPEAHKFFDVENIKSNSSSPKTEGGHSIPYVLHVTNTRIWVSKNFVHFGASQRTLATTLNLSERTVRRHQRLQNMERRQICQKKETYMWVKSAWDNDSPEYYHDKTMLKAAGTGSDSNFKIIGYTEKNGTVRFTDGVALGQKKKSPNRWDIPATEFGNRFFKMGADFWMNRCNVYKETLTLTTMRTSKRSFKSYLKALKIRSQQKFGSAVVGATA